MRQIQWIFCFVLVGLLMGRAAMAQEKVQLVHKAIKGQKMTYEAQASLSGEAGGAKLVLEIKQTSQEEITDVSTSGEITRESRIEQLETTVNGLKMPTPESATRRKQIMVIKPDGTLVSLKWEGGEVSEAERKSENRMALATQMVFSGNPVGVGDRWSREFKEDAEKGTPPAIAEYEVLALEKAKGVDTVKLRVSFRETAASGSNMTLSGEVWVEKASGDVVTASYHVQNLPFGSPEEKAPPIGGTMRVERTGGSPLGGVAAQKKEKTIEDVVKDYEKIPGLFTLYRKKEAGKDTLYMEVREEQLDRLMLLQVTAASGTGSFALVAGNPIDDILFKLVKRGDDQIVFLVPNIKFRADPHKPIARAVKRSFADAYLETFKIEAKSEERKSLLISAGDLFRSDIAQITQRVSAAGGASYTIDREKTIFSTLKNFPTNLVIQTAYNLTRAGGGPAPGPTAGGEDTLADARSVPVEITYNLFFLPENNYKPRLADPRVGYFLTDFQDFSKDKEEQTTRYILRWHLEKADPKAKVSPPKEPIVFWLDNAIPQEYRGAVRKGLLWWNQAFERIGFKDAMVVRQMPDNADWEHSDMRYNVIRWVASPASGYAVALFRANPLTGQMLNASITVDANMTRYARIEFQQMIDPLRSLEPDPQPTHPFQCTLAEEAPFQVWLGATAMSLLASPRAARISEQQYIDSYIASIVAHEMGHILGLRHNFIASTRLTLKELGQGSIARRVGVVASVMEYFPFNIMALHSPGTPCWPTHLGEYDLWAIEYGYKPLGARSPEAELPALRKIASRCNEPGHAYESDETADQFDPLITRFDLARDPLEYWGTLLRDLQMMIPRLEKRMVPVGESYWKLTRTFNGLLGQYARGAMIITRYVGGVHLRKNHRGDPREKPPVVPVNAMAQRKALGLLTRYVFSPKAFNFPKSLYLRLAPNPYPDWGQLASGRTRMDAPVRDTIAGIQRSVLSQLFHSRTLSRIANNEFKSAQSKDTLTLPLLFEDVGSVVNAEIVQGANISSLRRLLQRVYLQRLSDMVLRPDSSLPDDARMLARYHLRQLKSHILPARQRPHDTYTRVHLEEMLDQINKVLDARYTVSEQVRPNRRYSLAKAPRFGVFSASWQERRCSIVRRQPC